jgi:hypothetical protein
MIEPEGNGIRQSDPTRREIYGCNRIIPMLFRDNDRGLALFPDRFALGLDPDLCRLQPVEALPAPLTVLAHLGLVGWSAFADYPAIVVDRF